MTDEQAFQFPSKIASGAEIVAAAIAWRNLDYAALRVVNGSEGAVEDVMLSLSTSWDAYDVFLALLDSRTEVIK